MNRRQFTRLNGHNATKTLHFPDGIPSLDATLVDYSIGGACFCLDCQFDLPDHFQVYFMGTLLKCSVRHKNNQDGTLIIGVKFDIPTQNAMPSLVNSWWSPVFGQRPKYTVDMRRCHDFVIMKITVLAIFIYLSAYHTLNFRQFRADSFWNNLSKSEGRRQGTRPQSSRRDGLCEFISDQAYLMLYPFLPTQLWKHLPFTSPTTAKTADLVKKYDELLQYNDLDEEEMEVYFEELNKLISAQPLNKELWRIRTMILTRMGRYQEAENSNTVMQDIN